MRSLLKKRQFTGRLTANGHCSDTTERAGKALQAVSGRDMVIIFFPPLLKKAIYERLTANGHCILPTVRAAKALHAVSGRDTDNTRPKSASKKATASLGMQGFRHPHGGVRRLYRLR